MAITPLENIMSDLVNAVLSAWTTHLGDWFWGIMFGLIIAGIYLKSESPGPPVGFMLILMALMTAVLDSVVLYFLGIMAGLGGAAILYFVFRGHD